MRIKSCSGDGRQPLWVSEKHLWSGVSQLPGRGLVAAWRPGSREAVMTTCLCTTAVVRCLTGGGVGTGAHVLVDGEEQPLMNLPGNEGLSLCVMPPV